MNFIFSFVKSFRRFIGQLNENKQKMSTEMKSITKRFNLYIDNKYAESMNKLHECTFICVIPLVIFGIGVHTLLLTNQIYQQ